MIKVTVPFQSFQMEQTQQQISQPPKPKKKTSALQKQRRSR